MNVVKEPDVHCSILKQYLISLANTLSYQYHMKLEPTTSLLCLARESGNRENELSPLCLKINHIKSILINMLIYVSAVSCYQEIYFFSVYDIN